MSQTTDENTAEGNQFVLPIILAVLGIIALGLALTWVNTQRTKLSYTDSLQNEVKNKQDLHNNLLFERENLLSPKALGELAEKLQLYTSKPGQVRRMDLAPKAEITHEGSR